MQKTQQKVLSGPSLRKAGWKALVDTIGLVNATRFVLQHESGYGDYATIKRQIFKNKSVNDICGEMKGKTK
jgi:hypothetical protein